MDRTRYFNNCVDNDELHWKNIDKVNVREEAKVVSSWNYFIFDRLKLRTYHHVGEAAFGKSGLFVTLGFQNATLLFVGTLFLILAGELFFLQVDGH